MVGFSIAMLAVTPALAHASFVSAIPRPGSGIAQAPGDVILRFSEPLVTAASRVEVRDETGTAVTDGSTEAVEGDDSAMRRPLGLLAPGVYTVEWTTLSPLDGHTLHGSYRFAVGASVSGGEQVQDSPLASEGALGLGGRFLALSGLSAWIGAALLRTRGDRAQVPEPVQRGFITAGPLAAAVGTGLSLASTSVVAGGGLGSLVDVISGGPSGAARSAVVFFGVAGMFAARRRRQGAMLAIAAAAVIAESASGHAGSNPAPLVTTAAFASHLTAVGVWVVCVAFSLAAKQPIARTLQMFAPVAIGAGIVVAVTGTASAVLQLNTVNELSSTAYGRVLSVKVAVVLLMATAGLAHRRIRTRAIDRSLWVPLSVEAVAAVTVIALATVLVGFPDPPREAAAAVVATDVRSRLATLTEGPAVTFADATGPYVVGVTLAPTAPSQRTVLVQVLGAAPGDAVRDVALEARSANGTSRADLRPCGPDCWTGLLESPDVETWWVRASGTSNRGDFVAERRVPVTPRDDGERTLQAMLEAMGDVRSAVVHEALRERADGAAIRSTYRFRAPDAMRWEVTTGGSTRIALGQTGYLRTTPEGQWNEYEWPGDGFRWPAAFYDSFFSDATAINVLGTEQISGQPATVVTFVQPAYPAWYRLMIDRDSGRLLRLEMRAERHVMDQTFESYDEPVDISAPLE